ncbi:MAG TPA: hypothetical protein VGI39_35010 [Polyangiaceae bacterium]|jgi:hypothetical protein
MGTWGEGLYDNDGALDELGDLFDALPLPTGPVGMATTIGLTTWLRPAATERLVEAVRQHQDWVTALPEEARELLQRLVRDPESFSMPGSRAPVLVEILGGYSDGHRHDALLTLAGSEKVLEELGAAAAERLDDGLRSASDLYEASSAVGCLGVILELATAGYWSPVRKALKEWRLNVDRLDEETVDEREFWEDYLSRLRRGLRMLKASLEGGGP